MDAALEKLINDLQSVKNDQLDLDLEDTAIISPPNAPPAYNLNDPIMWPTTMNSTTSTSGSSSVFPYTYTTNGTGGVVGNYGITSTDYTNGLYGNKGLHVKTDAEFEGDIKIKGKSLNETLDKIEQRLAILHPNEKLEERWEELKALGDAYRKLEKDIIEKEKIWDTLKK